MEVIYQIHLQSLMSQAEFFPGLYSLLCLVLFLITQPKRLEQPGKVMSYCCSRGTGEPCISDQY